MRTGLLSALLVIGSLGAEGDVFRVKNLNDAGVRSLRWAINSANSHGGPDRILFAVDLAGCVIYPATPLPELLDDGTRIDGDIDNDGAPDIALNGKNLTVRTSGLRVKGDNCIIEGLAIAHWDAYGLFLDNVTGCHVRSCHIGVNLAGTAAVNNSSDIFLTGADGNTIGGSGTGNVICGGYRGAYQNDGLKMQDSSNNVISHNYFGVNRGGTAILGQGNFGVSIGPFSGTADSNVIRGNLFAGLYYGVFLDGANNNVVTGNTFGLGANGRTRLRIRGDCIRLEGGASGNRIGGATAAARNVFAGNPINAIEIGGTGTTNNRVVGNYFGTSADGKVARPLRCAINITGVTGPQTIGGSTAGQRNYFASSAAGWWGVNIAAGSGTLIQGNHFGKLPSGAASAPANTHVCVLGTEVRVLSNLMVGAADGVSVQSGSVAAAADIYGNTFRDCTHAVHVFDDSVVRLGNLGNAAGDDDGWNVFRPTNTWHVRNEGTRRVRAEGNDFGTTSRAAIEAKIYDRLDDPALGRVDFIPLAGGVIPTDDAGTAGVLVVMSASAAPTAAGASIGFTLSSAATVQACVLNLAGRQVATVCREEQCEAGRNTLLWNAQNDRGLPVPGGTYLVEVSARASDGRQARGLTQVRLSR